jgi:Peptidase A4 family
VRLRLTSALTIAALLALGAAPAALADANTSSNWAGYAVHRSGVKFRKVQAVWTQPSAMCQPGQRTYSAYWVGLGGYRETSQALEQIGTEVDCSAAGQVRSGAWYELVPAASKTIRLRVRPGDELFASVVAVRHRITVTLTDSTSHHTFRRTLHAEHPDVSSADWIVEAPSDCVSETACQTLPLADFGSASFGLTLAQTTNGHLGAISDRHWRSSKISLRPGAGRGFVSQGPASAVGEAIPSALNATGTGFAVGYSAVPVQPDSVLAARRASSSRAGHLVHVGR